jgi:hypothetical protein
MNTKLQYLEAPEMSRSRIELTNAVFWDVAPCDCRKNRLFGGACRLHHQGEKSAS